MAGFLCGFSVELRVEVVLKGEPQEEWLERWRRRAAAKDLWFVERACTQIKITRVISHRLCGTYLNAGERVILFLTTIHTFILHMHDRTHKL